MITPSVPALRAAATPTPAIELREITRTFDDRPALRGLDLKIASGEALVIFGPNGAGKTTLLKILATLLRPSAGTVLFAGLDIQKDLQKVRRRLGVVSHSTYLYQNLTAYENLDFYRRMYAVPTTRIRAAAALVGMESCLAERLGTLSRGQQQRLAIARALLHQPDVILLDEPETGLDPQALAALWQILRAENGRPQTLVLATHNLERGLEIADRIVILCRGQIVYRAARSALDLPALRQAYELHTRARP
jgi:heme ABC exporter ATP-binding subunit CcmA